MNKHNKRMKLNDHVTLEMDTDRPYKYHSEVKSITPPGRSKDKKCGKPNKERGRGR